MSSRPRRYRAALLLIAVTLAWSPGCAARQPGEAVRIDRLAVLPIELAQAEDDARMAGHERRAPHLPVDAGAAVTAQIYRVLAHRTAFHFVPDLTVADAVALPAVRRAPTLVDRAVALGKAVGADGVIFGRVSRFRKRVGTELGASEPAAVSFDMSLVAVDSGAVIWEGRFDQTQEPLSANLFNFWMFWRAGPRWFTARQLAGLGVEKLVDEMTRSARR